MEISIHSKDAYRPNSKGLTYLVRQRPNFTLDRGNDGKLWLTVEVTEEQEVGTGEQGGAFGKSVKCIQRTGTVEFEPRDLKELYQLLAKELFSPTKAAE